ncbi:hypothetical protein L873DRAFT_1262150 [Choiromyces venosus 120613-1]|uniref:Uncharacterized protein n=1 Tax=Choiromyces venosus 120613-1 TaxID=1336337 RepID=A0A3N4JI47_9PEZI|nr:hypothetical protein L873DRAFT_1262150 [Choiromyces venosus 120613-1]
MNMNTLRYPKLHSIESKLTAMGHTIWYIETTVKNHKTKINNNSTRMKDNQNQGIGTSSSQNSNEKVKKGEANKKKKRKKKEKMENVTMEIMENSELKVEKTPSIKEY